MSPNQLTGQALGIWNHGWLFALLVTLASSWVAMNVIALMIEGRWLVASEQFQSFWKGDLIALPGLAALVAVMVPRLPHATDRWYQSTWWQLLMVGVGVGFSLLCLLVLDRGRYTRRQLLSPTKLWHSFVPFLVITYWLVGAGLPCLLYSTWGLRGTIGPHLMVPAAILVLVAYFVALVVADTEREYPWAHVNNGWPWQRSRWFRLEESLNL